MEANSYLLFKALLAGNDAAALRLLAASSDPAQLVLPASNFTALHAAALGGCEAAIHALVAAGVAVDATLQLPGSSLRSPESAELRELLAPFDRALQWRGMLVNGTTALPIAMRMRHERCMLALLDQGADALAGNGDGAPLQAARFWCIDMAAPLLAHLEQQRRSGTLQLRNKRQAVFLIEIVVRREDGPHFALLLHGLAALRQLVGSAYCMADGSDASGGSSSSRQLATADADILQQLLSCVVKTGQPAVLEALMASCLPFNLVAEVSRVLSASCVPAAQARVAPLLLAHLEQQGAAGTLQLDNTEQAVLFIQAAVRSEGKVRLPLVRHILVAVKRLLDATHSSDASGSGLSTSKLAAADADLLQQLLGCVVDAGQPALLEALLESGLPFNVCKMNSATRTLLASAALRPNAAACVRLLHQAGAHVTATDLYCAIDHLSADGVAALLSCGVPAIDISVPAVKAYSHYKDSWSCPIHRALRQAELAGALSQQDSPAVTRAAQILEALWAAGYRPTVYRQARLPAFLWPFANAPAAAELDPFALLDMAPQHGSSSLRPFGNSLFRSPAGQRLLFLARTGGAWSLTTHHHWPEAFKQAARTLLLCAAAGSRLEGGQDASQPAPLACLLSSVPQDALLLVLKHAAEPMGVWMAHG